MTTPVPTAASSTNGSLPVPPAAAPTRSAQREGGASSLGTFGVKSGLAQMLKVGIVKKKFSKCRSQCIRVV
jgi:pyridoxal 5'-phosphate synthase pdxS subunit